MTHDVFISHSSKDKVIADAVCAALENAKIRCWIAPRDILPGEKWAGSITKSITNSKIMVLIFSYNSNNSDDVLNELLLAKDAGAIIIPFKIGNILPKGEMEYYLKRTHWLDAMDPPTEKQIQSLVETVKQFIKGSSSITTPDLIVRVEAVALEPKTYTNSIGMKFAFIPGGEFMMGSEEEKNEKPVHRVKINKSFYLGIYPVTQSEWKAVMGKNPSYFEGDNLPVERVSWNDVQDFIKKLNDKEGGNKYRLPTEAEWEYAERAGTTTRYSFGDDESKLGDYAWYDANSGDMPHDVGQKKPNQWGLFDMHGNVCEWVQDKWHGSYYVAPVDGSSWESGDDSFRVIRSGSRYDHARDCRSVVRDRYDHGGRSLSFRLLRIS